MASLAALAYIVFLVVVIKRENSAGESMETIKFELHDMATMMTAIMCFLFATMIVVSGKFKTNSACLLAGFFLAQGDV